MLATRIKSAASRSKRLWSRNMKTLEQYMPAIAQAVAAPNDPPHLKTVAARSGAPSLQISRPGAATIHVHSTYDPKVEAAQWAGQEEENTWQIGVVLGIGLGYHLDELIRRYPTRKLIVVEPDIGAFVSMLQSRDVRPLLRHANLTLLIGNHPMDVAIKLFQQHLRSEVSSGPVAFLAWPPAQRIWSDFWQELQAQVGELLQQDLVNIATYNRFALRWQDNLFKNLRTSISDPSMPLLANAFAGKPVIIAASGPSLEKNVHLLAEVRDRALIVAAGSALGALRAHGIEPDFVVSFDAGSVNYYHFARQDTTDLILFYSAVLYPRIVAEHEGPRFALGVDIYPYERWIFEQMGIERGSVASGPSVANLAWDLVRQMGCDPIVLIGQDLAFSAENTSHAQGVALAADQSSYHQARMEEQPDTYVWVEDIWGNKVRSLKQWLAMKVWFEQRIAYLGRDRTVIDATEGGARIAGTQIMTLRQVIDRYCAEPFYPKQQIMDVYHRETQRLAATDLEARLAQVLASIDEDLSAILSLCDQGAQPLKELAGRTAQNQISDRSLQQNIARLTELDRQINRVESYRQFIHPSIAHVRTALDVMSAALRNEVDVHRKGEQAATLYASFFDATRNMALATQKLVRASLERQAPYHPQDLAGELRTLFDLCRQAEQAMAEATASSQAQHEQSGRAGAAHPLARLARLKHQVEQMETYQYFVRDLLVANRLSRSASELSQLGKAADRKNREGGQTITQWLAFFSAFFGLVQEAAEWVGQHSGCLLAPPPASHFPASSPGQVESDEHRAGQCGF